MRNSDRNRAIVEKVAASLGLPFDYTSASFDQFLPIIERMRLEGAVVLVKWDGERGIGDNGPYTIVISRSNLQGDFFRTDTDSLTEALVAGIAFYAQKKWKIEA